MKQFLINRLLICIEALLLTNIFLPIHAQSVEGSLYSVLYSLPHRDNSLNLYDFGKNPAWLSRDELQSWLKITPSFSNITGDYRRKYDFEESYNYNFNFTTLKPLSSGTFLGYASYDIENRYDVYRSLKYDTYAGEAFFSTDTTTGNFSYKGPKVGFTYSFELLPGWYLGTSVNYGVMDGLKNKYSRAGILYRQAGAEVGTAYEINKSLVIGSTISFNDTQEKIDSRNNDYEVEIYNYRGETYSVAERRNIVSQKIKKDLLNVGSQIYVVPSSGLELALKGCYSLNNTKIIIPRADIKEAEDGFAETRSYNLNFQGRYSITKNISAGIYAGYEQYKNWSRNSLQNLLLWEWKIKKLRTGTGISFFLHQPEMVLSLEAEYNFIQADSNKYIDHRSADLASHDYQLKLYTECEIWNKYFLNAVIIRGYDETDLLYGADNVNSNSFSAGLFRMWEDLRADLMINYRSMSPGTGVRRFFLNTVLELKFFTF